MGHLRHHLVCLPVLLSPYHCTSELAFWQSDNKINYVQFFKSKARTLLWGSIFYNSNEEGQAIIIIYFTN